MKSTFIVSAIAILSLPAPGLAAGKEQQARARLQAPAEGSLPDGLGPFDKNGNRRIEGDELAAVQGAFAALKKLDRNGNGEIEPDEIRASMTGGRRSGSEGARARAAAGLQRVDTNGNRRIDPGEVASLEKMLGDGRGEMMKRLDQNGNGRLEEAEIARLNERLEKGGSSRRPGAGRATPGFRRPPEKPAGSAPSAETIKPGSNKDGKPDGAAKTDEKKIEFGS